MNMFKKNGGFTLVELIVVIAILAILAGVAVPAYSGYISKANEAGDLTQLDSIKTATVFAATDKNASVTLDKIVVTLATNAVVVTDFGADGVEGGTDDVEYGTAATYDADHKISISTYTNGTVTFKSGKTTATWTATSGKWVLE